MFIALVFVPVEDVFVFECVYIYCILRVPSVVVSWELAFVYCVPCCCFRLLSSRKEMELQNEPHVLEMGESEKQRATST